MSSSEGKLETVDREEREQEYLSAQTAAAEALDVGRETLTAAAIQSEQLTNANQSADQAEYALDKSARLLRGMTWSGWVANMFTKDVEAPTTTGDTVLRPIDYSDIPEPCQAAAQAIQNYRCNLMVLDKCETDEQKQTCKIVCDSAYDVAAKEIAKLKLYEGDAPHPAFTRLSADLSKLRYIQKQKTELGVVSDKAGLNQSDESLSEPKKLFVSETTQACTRPLERHQEEHLSTLSNSLGELNSIGRSLGQVITEQNDLLQSITEKADSNLDKSKLVTRKADKLTQKKAWKKTTKKFQSWITIQHIKTGKFLTVSNGTLMLSEMFDPDAVFGIWQKQGSIVGLQHQSSQRWVGQSLVGSLSCNATSFGNRQEWEFYDDWEQTRLLCVSANWGSGGFIICRQDGVVSLSGNTADAKKEADLWCMAESNE